MNLYISDLHFGHKNVIGFDHRPFQSVDEMDHFLIEMWNSRVSPDDDVWVIGDFCFRSSKSPVNYLRQLRGRKHLVIGNHDGAILKDERARSHFETIDKIVQIEDMVNGSKEAVVMCHFPIAEWNRSQHGSYHVYGHIHNRKDGSYLYMRTCERALNAGCMINNYAPASMRELIENNKRFQAED